MLTARERTVNPVTIKTTSLKAGLRGMFGGGDIPYLWPTDVRVSFTWISVLLKGWIRDSKRMDRATFETKMPSTAASGTATFKINVKPIKSPPTSLNYRVFLWIIQ
jgi:hypothetical protein